MLVKRNAMLFPWVHLCSKHAKLKMPVTKGPHIAGFNLFEMHRVDKSREKICRLVVDQSWGRGWIVESGKHDANQGRGITLFGVIEVF